MQVPTYKILLYKRTPYKRIAQYSENNISQALQGIHIDTLKEIRLDLYKKYNSLLNEATPKKLVRRQKTSKLINDIIILTKANAEETEMDITQTDMFVKDKDSENSIDENKSQGDNNNTPTTITPTLTEIMKQMQTMSTQLTKLSEENEKLWAENKLLKENYNNEISILKAENLKLINENSKLINTSGLEETMISNISSQNNNKKRKKQSDSINDNKKTEDDEISDITMDSNEDIHQIDTSKELNHTGIHRKPTENIKDLATSSKLSSTPQANNNYFKQPDRNIITRRTETYNNNKTTGASGTKYNNSYDRSSVLIKNNKPIIITGRREIKEVKIIEKQLVYALLISRLEPSISSQKVSELVTTLGLTPLKVIKLETRSTQYSSFRLIIPRQECDLAFKPDTWPTGMLVRKFYYPRRHNNNNRNEEPSKGNNADHTTKLINDYNNKSNNNNNNNILNENNLTSEQKMFLEYGEKLKNDKNLSFKNLIAQGNKDSCTTS